MKSKNSKDKDKVLETIKGNTILCTTTDNRCFKSKGIIFSTGIGLWKIHFLVSQAGSC